MGCCVGSGTGGGGGLLCANNKTSTPRYSPLGKPAHPTDRPTGTMKQLFFGGGLVFLACALSLSSRSNRAAAISRTTTKMSPYFCIVRCHYYRILLLLLSYPLNYVLQRLLFCYVWWLCMAINISVQHNGGLLPDIILLIQGYYYYHRETRFKYHVVALSLQPM